MSTVRKEVTVGGKPRERRERWERGRGKEEAYQHGWDANGAARGMGQG
jgi:hypothetical protein